jgi:hypothetical protein
MNLKILLSKLQFYGREGKFYDLITSYLSDRYQRVLIASTDLSPTSSSWKTVRHGVPQGSILGPFLFLFCMNDLTLNFNSTVKSLIFADDISLVVSSYNNGQYINDVNITFARLNDWLNSNVLTLNFNKTKDVQFATKSTSSEITVSYHNNVMLRSLNVKFFGLVIESSCTWKAHML